MFRKHTGVLAEIRIFKMITIETVDQKQFQLQFLLEL